MPVYGKRKDERPPEARRQSGDPYTATGIEPSRSHVRSIGSTRALGDRDAHGIACFPSDYQAIRSISRYAGSLIRIPPELNDSPEDSIRSMIACPPESRRSRAFLIETRPLFGRHLL